MAEVKIFTLYIMQSLAKQHYNCFLALELAEQLLTLRMNRSNNSEFPDREVIWVSSTALCIV